jgi:hypothetical protein
VAGQPFGDWSSDPSCGLEFFPSQLKDDRQLWPEIRALFSPVTVKFNFE